EVGAPFEASNATGVNGNQSDNSAPGSGAAYVFFSPAAQQVPTDQTPPLITATVAGTVGASGWYRGAVTVTWAVTDAESGIQSTSGCSPTTLTADTIGVTLTCAATNGAGLST